ncbi:hypothetical protein [Roseobacter ponti]|uniref:Uncharacterized protein n=1 Tax=Roseobacter ponti TaxID=1891787 RepID=A0A858SV30_9RHOB|nr:hypothetical protein [Roseobacter ponti]QJF51848.1 hypothetical protein G3256_12080 [Roseobacter ponti]
MGSFKHFILIAALVPWPSTALAQCRVCDEVIELNSDYARCFNSAFEEILAEAATSPNGRARVDLASCDDGTGEKDRGGLLVMPSVPGPQKISKSVYLLDETYIICLKELLSRHADELDPTRTFDLYEECRDG